MAIEITPEQEIWVMTREAEELIGYKIGDNRRPSRRGLRKLLFIPNLDQLIVDVQIAYKR